MLDKYNKGGDNSTIRKGAYVQSTGTRGEQMVSEPDSTINKFDIKINGNPTSNRDNILRRSGDDQPTSFDGSLKDTQPLRKEELTSGEKSPVEDKK